MAAAFAALDRSELSDATPQLNVLQRVGGSIGTALLSSIFASAVSSFAKGKPPSPQVAADAAMHGYTVAFWVAAGVFALGAVVVGSLMRSIKIGADAPAEPPSARFPAGGSPRIAAGSPGSGDDFSPSRP